MKKSPIERYAHIDCEFNDELRKIIGGEGPNAPQTLAEALEFKRAVDDITVDVFNLPEAPKSFAEHFDSLTGMDSCPAAWQHAGNNPVNSANTSYYLLLTWVIKLSSYAIFLLA